MDFANLCEWFVDNKQSIHLGEGKTKCILFGLKLKLKNAGKLNIMYNRIRNKAILPSNVFGLRTGQDNVCRIIDIKNH